MASTSTLEASLTRWAHPRVLVLASSEVERMIGRSHLSFADLLKPLGGSLEATVPAAHFRSVSRAYALKHFGVRFVAPVELEAAAALAGSIEGAASSSAQAALNNASTDAFLDGVLRDAQAEPQPGRFKDGVQEPPDVPGFLRTTPEPTPWFNRYRGEFHETLRYHESELIDQPLALLVAVSTSDANPLNLIEQLRSLRNLPGVFQKGIYDSPANMLRSIVVLHDKHTEVPSDPDARERGANTFRLIKKQYGAEVLRLLEINSLPTNQPNLKQKDIWKADCERTRWQTRQARGGKKAEDGAATPSAASAAAPSPSPPPPTFLQPTLPTQSFLSPHTPHPPPSIRTDGDSIASSSTPEPTTPGSQAAALVSAASSAVASSALAEMGADEAATVEQEQAQEAERIKQAAEEEARKSPQTASSSSSGPIGVGELPAGQARGQYLSPADLVQTSAFIGDFLLKALLPHLERKIASLGDKVSAVRKGFKNSLKAFFGTRDTTKKPPFNPRLGTYDWATVESQARQLADLAFVVQDYELAASTYRVCAGDYRRDKVSRHYAASQEMLGLSIALGDTSGIISNSTLRELASALESAISSFASVGDVRRATRAAWFFADCLRWMGGAAKANECSAVLLRASEKEQSIRAALCMEQAAYLFLHHLPTPLVRKYAFHLVMAGHLFHKFHAKLLGVRAYSAATLVYEHRAWFSVNDHLNYSLGKEYFHLQKYHASVRHFISLIGETQAVAGVKPKQTQEKQQVFLKEFVFVVQKWQEIEAAQEKAAVAAGGAVNPMTKLKSQLVGGLKLPTVIDDSIVVQTAAVDTVASCYTVQGWTSALRVNPLMTLDKAACNKPLLAQNWNTYREADRGCVVNETVRVTFSVSNPLLIELQCSHLRLQCKWKLPATEDGGDEIESREGVLLGTPPTAEAAFTYSSLSLSLGPLETATVVLEVTPLRQGVLVVEGMLWDVAEVLKGFHPFALPMRQVTFPVVGGRRRKPELQPDPSLVIPVTPPAPLLALSIPTFPPHLHQGEVAQCTMRLANRGPVALHKVCVRLSHPGFMVLAPPPRPSDVTMPTGTQAACYEHTWNEGYIQLPLTLQPGEEVELPLYLRGTIEGQHTIGLLVKYEPTTPAGGLKHRLAYLSFPLVVTPLFGVKVFTRPSFQTLADSLVGLELQDKQQTIPGLAGTSEYASLAQMAVHTLPVHLSQVSVLSKMWTIAPLASASASDPLVLNAPRKLHSSVSSPIVSLLKHDASSYPRGGGAHAIGATPPSSGVAPSAILPAAHVLRPYEALVQYFRVTNLPGVFAVPTPASLDKPVHTSASAQNLREQAHGGASANARKVHHSSVQLSAPTGSALVIDPAHPAVAHLLHMEKQLMVEAEKQTLIVNPAAVLADVAAHNRLDLVCCWRSPDGTRSGFFHAPGLASMKSQPAACSLKVQLHFPRHVVHDFRSMATGGGGDLDVPVVVSIRNTLEDAAVTFAFETLPPEEEFDAAKRSFKVLASASRRGRYTWSGSTKCRVVDLQPGETVHVNLFANFAEEGVFNLNRYRFTVDQPTTAAPTAASSSSPSSSPQPPPKKPRVFFFPLQHLIQVSHQTNGATTPTTATTAAAAAAPLLEAHTEEVELEALDESAAAPLRAHANQPALLAPVDELDVLANDVDPATTSDLEPAANPPEEEDEQEATAAVTEQPQDDEE